jgi:hypothetical protein
LAKNIRARERGIIQRILEASNADRVAGLNAQQQADFLRGVTNSRSARRLAKRAGEHADAGNLPEAVRQNLRAGKTEHERRIIQNGCGRSEDEIVSFYSQASASECIEAGAELADDNTLSSVQPADALQICGGVGVPIESQANNFPDPWAFRVSTLFPGFNLAECDVWLARSQGDGKFLACPGHPGSTITGVIPLRSADPESYRIYTESMRTLAELHASVTLRRLLAPVPYDCLARDTAGLWYLVEVLANRGYLREVEQKLLLDLVENIRHAFSRYAGQGLQQLIHDASQEDDPRPFFTGDRDVGNMLKLVAVCVGSETVRVRAVDRHTGPPLMRAIYELWTYHSARKQFGNDSDSRTASLHLLLGIDLARNGTPCQPLFEEEPDEVQVCEQWSESAAAELLLSSLITQTGEASSAASAAASDTSNALCVGDKHASGDSSPSAFRAASEAASATGDGPVPASKPSDADAKSAQASQTAQAPQAPQVPVVPKPAFMCALHHVLNAVGNGNPQLLSEKLADIDIASVAVLGCSNNLAHISMAVRALTCSREKDRVDTETRQALYSDLVDDQAARSSVTNAVRKEYLTDYMKRLAEKRAVERAERLRQLVNSLISCEEPTVFLELLNREVDNRNHDSFQPLCDALLNFEIEVPERQFKAMVLMIGRNLQDEIIWAMGNVMRWKQFRSFRTIFTDHKEMWNIMSRIRSTNSRHKYRESGLPNRHGYSNEFPSFWARGYDTLQQMIAEAPEEYKAYAAEHRRRKGYHPKW